MKKLVLGMMLVLGSLSFSNDKDESAKDFISGWNNPAYSSNEQISRETPEDLEGTDVREFFRTHLNNYDE